MHKSLLLRFFFFVGATSAQSVATLLVVAELSRLTKKINFFIDLFYQQPCDLIQIAYNCTACLSPAIVVVHYFPFVLIDSKEREDLLSE